LKQLYVRFIGALNSELVGGTYYFDNLQVKRTKPFVWEHPETGRIWQYSSSYNAMSQPDAYDYCEGLNLPGYTGNWSLPTIDDLRTLIDSCSLTESDGSCAVNESCTTYDNCHSADCNGCSEGGGPDNGCYWLLDGERCDHSLWSSTGAEALASWAVNYSYAAVVMYSEDSNLYARCIQLE